MNRLSIDYPPGTVPNISVQLETAKGRKIVVGDVDSGSDRSLCPIEIASDLGLATDDLKQNPGEGLAAVGDGFQTWSTDGIAITGQIVLPDLNEGGFKPWGPMFSVDIAFAKHAENLLLGRRDFFADFDLMFLNRSGGSILEICECAGPPKGP